MAASKSAHVPYKGNSPAITDLVGGQMQMIFATMPTVLPMVKAGRLRAIAVIGPQRSQLDRALRTRGHADGDRGAAQRGGS